ncbi:hypothetical protein GGR42_001506 [Saonia flava]|uniref:HPt domain-containing protein n=1 Tax=Saonia flava TaxID=523696 RepID=A0A846R0Z8_9FLAO|nr:Hpt domain-containing protein [Saonia flava]NJB71044.1 hypothetical protein [Saonia flava]
MKETPNLKYIKELSGDDEAFEKQFINIIKTELPVEVETYENTVKENKLFETAEIVHKLKHKLNIFGLEDAYRLAVRYEEDLKRGETILEGDFKGILEGVQKFVNTL